MDPKGKHTGWIWVKVYKEWKYVDNKDIQKTKMRVWWSFLEELLLWSVILDSNCRNDIE